MDVESRFWSKVAEASAQDCWPWEASITPHGYGQFAVAGRGPLRAHRVAYELAFGPIPDGEEVTHTCARRECVNPAHLRLRSELPREPRRKPTADRFWSHVDRRKAGDCWPWTGVHNAEGAGMFARTGRAGDGVTAAHRAAYELLVGPIPLGQQVRHTCGTADCVNPQHLALGRWQDEQRKRMVSPEAIASRFWSKVEKSAGCWVWVAGRGPSGYGKFQLGPSGAQRHIRAHRMAWELTYGPIPIGLYVCHACDNPPCVRPDHLFLGTTTENIRDAKAKGRLATGERHGSRTQPERFSRRG